MYLTFIFVSTQCYYHKGQHVPQGAYFGNHNRLDPTVMKEE